MGAVLEMTETMYGESDVRRELASLPKITTQDQALREIRRIALDKRDHLLMADSNEWLQIKLAAIARLAYRGMKCDD